MRAFARHMTEHMKAVAAAGAVAAFWLAAWMLVAGDFGGLERADTGRAGSCRGVWWRACRDFVTFAGVCAPGGSGAVVCKGDAGRLRGGPVAYLAGVGTREHRGGLFDGAAGRVFFAGRGLDASG